MPSIRFRPAVHLGPIVVAVLYYSFAWLALDLTQGVDGIATVWPPSGILLAALLMTKRGRVPYYVAASAVASAAANLAVGSSMTLAIILTIANMGESVLAWWLLRGRHEPQPGFVQPAEIGRFCVVAAMAAAASATLAVTGTLFAGGPQFFMSWFLTDLLGILLVTPLILMTSDAALNRNPDITARWHDLVLLLGLVTVVSTLVFMQAGYPILFLPLVALLAATFWLGPIGAAAGVLIMAVIGTGLTMDRQGPIMLVQGGAGSMSLFLQFYLLVMLGTALPLAALLATRNRLARAVGESNRLLRMAERTAQLGHWSLDMVRQKLVWSPEVFRLYGLPVGEMPELDGAITAYHPDDRPMVEAFIEALTTRDDPDGAGFGFEARLVNPDGTVRHVLSRGHAERAPDGTLLALFGVVQDVTERVRAAEALEAARAAAETAADTDQLTGLASRRRALRVLESAMAAAKAENQPLSAAIFDIDHFKAVNDRFGHQVGDEVLRRVAQAALGASRRDDLIGRLGGEEFMLLLPGADEAIAMMVAERVRCAIEASGPVEEGDGPRVTISIGVARLEAAIDISPTQLLNRADRALYAAKRSGRNRLQLAA